MCLSRTARSQRTTAAQVGKQLSSTHTRARCGPVQLKKVSATLCSRCSKHTHICTHICTHTHIWTGFTNSVDADKSARTHTLILSLCLSLSLSLCLSVSFSHTHTVEKALDTTDSHTRPSSPPGPAPRHPPGPGLTSLTSRRPDPTPTHPAAPSCIRI